MHQLLIYLECSISRIIHLIDFMTRLQFMYWKAIFDAEKRDIFARKNKRVLKMMKKRYILINLSGIIYYANMAVKIFQFVEFDINPKVYSWLKQCFAKSSFDAIQAGFNWFSC